MDTEKQAGKWKDLEVISMTKQRDYTPIDLQPSDKQAEKSTLAKNHLENVTEDQILENFDKISVSLKKEISTDPSEIAKHK